MRAWAAFSASDMNQDNELSSTELKFLLYVFEGAWPSDER